MTPPTPSGGGYRLARALVRLGAWLVPLRQRERWIREWDGELWHRAVELGSEARAPWRSVTRLVWPACGAVVHAAWMRGHAGASSGFLRDVRFALRSHVRSPGFTWAAVGTLTLGISGNVAVLAIANGALLTPYPYQEPDRVLVLLNRDARRPGEALRLSYPDVALVAETGAFESVTAYDWDPANLRVPDGARWVGVGHVSPTLLQTLGVAPLHGRGFLPGEDAPGAEPVALLGERLWRGPFGG